MAEAQLSFLPEPKGFKTDVLRPGDTLVITPQMMLTIQEADMIRQRLEALGIQFVILGPNLSAVSEPSDSRPGGES